MRHRPPHFTSGNPIMSYLKRTLSPRHPYLSRTRCDFGLITGDILRFTVRFGGFQNFLHFNNSLSCTSSHCDETPLDAEHIIFHFLILSDNHIVGIYKLHLYRLRVNQPEFGDKLPARYKVRKQNVSEGVSPELLADVLQNTD